MTKIDHFDQNQPTVGKSRIYQKYGKLQTRSVCRVSGPKGRERNVNDLKLRGRACGPAEPARPTRPPL